MRLAGVHGWLQVAAIETAVSKQTSSFPKRAISTSLLFRGSGAHVFVVPTCVVVLSNIGTQVGWSL